MKRFASYEIVSKIPNDNGIAAGLNAYGFDYVFKLPRENRAT
jgi:hypothetical protein